MKVLKEREVNVTEYTTASGTRAYEVKIALTKDMLWLKYPKKSRCYILKIIMETQK